jgi:S-adenosylmethionine decarboxylase
MMMEAPRFFEGMRKLLKVWFSRQQTNTKQGSGHLHTIPRSEWGVLLKDVQCSITSVTKTDKQKVHVLSENSIFVSKKHPLTKN